tara:strand:- start:1406 stop:1591 length:186 start_codon:yes stop_codon:yes gene_type:complete
MERIRIALQGYKTYMVAIIAVLTAILAWLTGEASLFEAIEAVLFATGLGTLRAGVATEAAK